MLQSDRRFIGARRFRGRVMQRRLAEAGVAVRAALDVADVGIAGGTTGATQRARQV